VAALEQQHAREVESLERQRAEELGAAEERRIGELAAADERRQDELAEAEEQRAAELAAAEERRTRELAAAEQRRKGELAAAADARAAAENELVERFEVDKTQLENAHAEAMAVARGAREEVETALAAAREQIKDLEGEMTRLVAGRDAALRERDEEIAGLGSAVEARDQRIAALRAEIEELESENAQFQEQVLKSYQKIKADEATVARAKKAMAIALTLLDSPKPLGESAAGDNNDDERPARAAAGDAD
jgi:chromosome segregation ATPase